ncbi:hypothetical protein DID88_006791 [Monilinia fructigena]|uniref:Uncharacterized protein n=1 Tax=Monilinia fructigena TaxID=38457 RepID=A0A395IGC7_9HELO|nr:hypothetical protein DID88_006791 [Monilinia fructigena]
MQDRNEGRQYIDAALGTMVNGLSEEERRRLWVYVLFADMDPSVHPLWGEECLGRVVDEHGGYELSDEKKMWLGDLMTQREWQIKGVFDYAYALNHCYNTYAPYIAIFEDDIIFAQDWFSRTISALSQTDLMIEEFAGKEGLERLALGKQVAQHVGAKSSRGNNQMNAMSTWAFHFEEYDKVSILPGRNIELLE